MNKLTKLIWELNQYHPDDIDFENKIVEEFINVEKDLIDKLEAGEEVSKEDLDYRNKLNKLVSTIPPYIFDVYDIKDQLKREGI